MTFPQQIDIVEEHVNDAVAKGAKVARRRPPRREGAGDFFEPTVLVDVDHTMECMTEETFGPTLPIMKVARRRGGDPPGQRLALRPRRRRCSPRTSARGEAVARRIEAGAVCVNDAMINYVALELPMGGWKASGLGSRHGAGGIRKYCEPAGDPRLALHTKRDLHMFPYNAKMLKLPLLWPRQARSSCLLTGAASASEAGARARARRPAAAGPAG